MARVPIPASTPSAGVIAAPAPRPKVDPEFLLMAAAVQAEKDKANGE